MGGLEVGFAKTVEPANKEVPAPKADIWIKFLLFMKWVDGNRIENSIYAFYDPSGKILAYCLSFLSFSLCLLLLATWYLLLDTFISFRQLDFVDSSSSHIQVFVPKPWIVKLQVFIVASLVSSPVCQIFNVLIYSN